MTDFTREQLREVAALVAKGHAPSLAAFALAQMERAEEAEAERDRLREELKEAREAIRQARTGWFLHLPPHDWAELPAVRAAHKEASDGKG